MINIIVEPALLIGVIFAVVMITLYSLRFINSELSTDWDIFITTLGIVYSSIIVIHGWRLDPILLFSQVLLVYYQAIVHVIRITYKIFSFLLKCE